MRPLTEEEKRTKVGGIAAGTIVMLAIQSITALAWSVTSIVNAAADFKSSPSSIKAKTTYSPTPIPSFQNNSVNSKNTIIS